MRRSSYMPSSKQNLLAQRARSDTKLDDFLLSGGLQLRVSLNDGTYSAVTPSRNLSFSLPYPLDFSWSKAFPKPPKPSNEEMRVQAVKKLNIRKNDAALCENKRFERLCDMACAAMSASYAQINLIDHEKSYSIQSRGFRPAVRIIPREESAGAHTLMYNEPLVIGDLRNDSRFSHHRICKDDDVRFFASFQICGPDRLVIGTFDIAHTLAKTGVSDATIEIVNKITRFIAEEIFKTCGVHFEHQEQPQDSEITMNLVQSLFQKAHDTEGILEKNRYQMYQCVRMGTSTHEY